MTRTPFVAAVTLTLGLLAACAGTPPTEQAAPASALDCAALQAQIAQAGEAQRNAAKKQHDAWKAVVPVAAAARFGQGVVEATQSQQRLSDLQSQALRQGCQGPGVVTGAARGEGLSTTTQGQGLHAHSLTEHHTATP